MWIGTYIACVILVSTAFWEPSGAGGRRERMKRVCQNTVLELNCGPDEKIVVRGAMFGRTQRQTNECGFQSTSRCIGMESVHIAAGYCALQAECKLPATTWRFGNPCPGIWKYLDVDYTCATANSIHSICDTESTLYVQPGDHGYLTSPNYPDVYTDANRNCVTHLLTSYGTEIDVTVFHVNYRDNNDCFQDELRITDHETNVDVKLCADSTRPNTLVGLRNATLTFGAHGSATFDTDLGKIAKGFSLEYRARGCPLEALHLPQDAHLHDYDYGVMATITCEDGFRFRWGKSGHCDCLLNHWKCDEPLECEPIPCDMDSFVVPNNTAPIIVHHGRQVRFRCMPGYVPANGTLGSLECDKGEWTGNVGECQEVECSLSSLSVPANMKMALSPDGRAAHFRCRYGFTPAGGALGSVSCERGNWTGSVGECQAVQFNGTSTVHKVAFSVHLSNNVTMVPSNLPVPYDVVTLNDSHSYDATSHVFEAPVKGVYVFSWSLRSVLCDTVVTLVKNQEVIDGGWLQGSTTNRKSPKANYNSTEMLPVRPEDGSGFIGGRTSLAGQAVVALDIDDCIWIQLKSNDPKEGRVLFVGTDLGFPLMTFTGHLLYSN